MGRPSKYEPEFAAQAEKLCRLGATDAELADFFEVSVRTLHRWKIENEGFCHSLKSAKAEADDRIERALFARASGFEYIEQQAIKIRTGEGTAERVEVVEVERVAPPDTTAAIFWLKNRRPEQWRESKAVELTGKDGGAIQTDNKWIVEVVEANAKADAS
jgi:hypothetical protein